jgi:uncharacterized membrane protein
MGLMALDAVLLWILSIPVVMGYRILPIEGTPHWLFGILFLILTVHLLVSLSPSLIRSAKTLNRFKSFCVWAVLIIVLGGTMVTSMVDRAKVAPVWGVHDIILQQEAAMRYLLVGKNPYKETYFGTPVESFNYDEPGNVDAVNPALYHFVMPPWYLLFPFPFYFASTAALGFFDARMPLLFLLVVTLGILYYWFRDKALGRLTIILTVLSPAVVDYIIEGRSDMFALSWLVGALFLLTRKKPILSAIVFGLALLTKQTIWFAVPFYALLVWKWQRKHVVMVSVAAAATVLVIAGPFVAWDPKAFVGSVILYLSGGSATSYPVSGYGLSMVLRDMGVIRDIHAYYPFALWQVALGIPVVIFALRYLSKGTSISKFFIAYGVTLGVVWYASRYFNNSHAAYLATIFLLGTLFHMDERGTA